MKELLAKAESIFHEALELPPEKREGFVLGACAADRELLEEVNGLLRASQVADEWLSDDDSAGEAMHARLQSVREGPGSLIGRYKLLEPIGEGGFGVVYMAEQQEPVRRKVALKIIKLGMDTRSVIARFEAERQALALMDHPNIAKVLDAGATETGRPYFVMELVRGVPITRFCDEHHLDTEKRLALFQQLCGAIQHAHQKRIIHRDIKPTNILVTINDGVAHPMVIDFGVAKALNQRLTEKTLFTNFAQMIGTPAYMSPEQAEMSKADVDARSDIYSLGVLLYELLTGTTPIPEKRLREAGYVEMQRMIREEEPEKPSTRLTRAGGLGLSNSASAVRVSRSDFPSDLDWIVMKCLEKERSRRYETSAALAMDLNHLLKNEPISARPAGNVYRAQKFIRRRRAPLAAAGLSIAALLAGMIANHLIRQKSAQRQPIDAVVANLPARQAQTPRNLIDLSKHYNVSLEGNAGWQVDPAGPHAIQKGPAVVGGARFDIRGAIRLASPYPQYVRLPFPERVEKIRIHQRCRRLHFLHFVFNVEQDDAPVATYVVRYADGEVVDIPVGYGRDVRTWSSFNRGSADSRNWLANTNSAIAWNGTNLLNFPIRLFRTTWPNPKPQSEIQTIDFISRMTDSAPVLVAITAEP